MAADAQSGMGMVSAGLGIWGTIISYRQQQVEFRLQQNLSALSIKELDEQRRFSKEERVFQLQEEKQTREEAESQYGFRKKELGFAGESLSIASLTAEIQSGFEQQDLRRVGKAAGAKARLETSSLQAQGAFQGMSALGRANQMFALSLASPIADKLAVAKMTGALTQQQFEIERQGLDLKGEELESAYAFNIQRLERSGEFSAAQFTSQQRQFGFRRKALKAQKAAAARQGRMSSLTPAHKVLKSFGIG